MKWFRKRRVSARALVIKNGQILVMHRRRHSLITGAWIDYYSIPGGGLEKDELPEVAVARELKEEMGLHLLDIKHVAHCLSRNFEHHVYTAKVESGSAPMLQPDSEEAVYHHTDKNQFIPEWVSVNELTRDNLRYYAGYLSLIHRLHEGESIDEVVEIES
ncbi:MAG: NUDIX domain-containing protein [Candidatus Saccharimonadales bacterium]